MLHQSHLSDVLMMDLHPQFCLYYKTPGLLLSDHFLDLRVVVGNLAHWWKCQLGDQSCEIKVQFRDMQTHQASFVKAMQLFGRIVLTIHSSTFHHDATIQKNMLIHA